MDPLTAAIIGVAAFGASGLGGLGQMLGAKSAKRAARKMRRWLERLVGQTKAEAKAASKQALAKEEIQRRLLKKEARRRSYWAKQRAAQAQYEIFRSPAYQKLGYYIQNLFERGLPDVIFREYADRLRTAQAARGLKGGQAARDEASFLTKIAHEARMRLIPFLRQLALDPLALWSAAWQKATVPELYELQWWLGRHKDILAAQAAAQAIGMAPFRSYLPIVQSSIGPMMGAYQFGAVSPAGIGWAGFGRALQTGLEAALTAGVMAKNQQLSAQLMDIMRSNRAMLA